MKNQYRFLPGELFEAHIDRFNNEYYVVVYWPRKQLSFEAAISEYERLLSSGAGV